MVALDDGGAQPAVRVLDGRLDVVDGLISRDHAGEGEEARLHDGVDPRAELMLLGHPVGVDGPDGEVLVDDLGLHFERQPVPQLLGAVRAIEQERGSRLGVGEDRHLLQQAELVARDEVSVFDEVRRPDGLGAETQVRHGHRARLLRVVHEVALGVHVGVLADDLHRRFVRADGAVGAESEEHRLHLARRPWVAEFVVGVEAQPGHVVVDAHGEAPFRAWFLRRVEPGQLVEHRLDMGGTELLRRQAVAPADHVWRPLERSGVGVHHVVQGGDDVEQQRLARRSRLLRAIQHGDRAHGRRQRPHEVLGRERTVEAHLQESDALARSGQGLDGLLGGARSGSHQHHHPVGVGRSDVVDQPVGATAAGGELAEHALDDAGHRVVERVGRLACLEEHVGVLGRAPQLGCVGREASPAMGQHGVVVHQRPQVGVVEHGDLVHLVRRPEAVEEVHERHPGPQRGGVGDGGEVVGLLDAAGSEHRPAGRAGVHDVGVVAEDRQGVSRDGAGGDVHRARGELAGDLEHVRNHQQQAL